MNWAAYYGGVYPMQRAELVEIVMLSTKGCWWQKCEPIVYTVHLPSISILSKKLPISIHIHRNTRQYIQNIGLNKTQLKRRKTMVWKGIQMADIFLLNPIKNIRLQNCFVPKNAGSNQSTRLNIWEHIIKKNFFQKKNQIAVNHTSYVSKCPMIA